MIAGKKVIVVMPAYNAAQTLKQTYDEIPHDIVDEILLVDDNSRDDTLIVAKQIGLTVFSHDRNYGYGRNQKTCYLEALRRGADIVVMIHPDYQYTPRLALAMASMIASGLYDITLGLEYLAAAHCVEVCPYTNMCSIESLLRSKTCFLEVSYRNSTQVIVRFQGKYWSRFP